MTEKIARRLKIKAGVRDKINGTAERPRMSVFRSNSQIYVQIIDDVALNGSGKTLASTSSLQIKEKMTKTEKSAKVGELIAGEAKKIGIEAVVFDRNGFLYHGRIKELAEAAREAGLVF